MTAVREARQRWTKAFTWLLPALYLVALGASALLSRTRWGSTAQSGTGGFLQLGPAQVGFLLLGLLPASILLEPVIADSPVAVQILFSAVCWMGILALAGRFIDRLRGGGRQD
jgi:hypothetical protein